MLLTGSWAMLSNYVEIERNPSDFDFISTIEEYETFVRGAKPEQIICARPMKGGRYMHVQLKLPDPFIDGEHLIMNYEFEIAWPGTTAEELMKRHGDGNGFLTKNELLMVKLSHRYLKNNPHFLKTMADIHLLRKSGAKLTPALKEMLKRRKAETYTYKHPNLSQDKKAFFTDSVKYVWEHDDIHVAIAPGGIPAYTHFSKDGAEVKVDKKKWDRLDHATRLRAVMEESMVLAIERSLVPFPGVLTPWEAYLRALEKVCTSITSGWFRKFAWDYYYEAAEPENSEWVMACLNDFKGAVDDGRVRPYSGKLY